MDYVSAMDEILSSANKPEDDFYNILGCDENASEEQITTEYKARVLSCHPDKHPNDQEAHEKFSRLSKAKDQLLDPERRREYDKWRRSGLALPFDTWRSMSHVKTSMHWGVRKPQSAISRPSEEPEGDQPGQCYMATQQTDSEHLQQLRQKMAFTPRENQSPTRSLSGWERDKSNPMLEKFRNYEI